MFFRLMQYMKRNFPSNNSPLVQLSLFHDKRGPVWSTLKIITDQLRKDKIDYALIGGLAVYEHGYQRSTHDCDLLLTKTGLKHFQERFVGRYVKPKFAGAQKKFICNDTKTPIDIITQGEYPGDGKEGPIEFPNPKTSCELIDGYTVISLPKLIELKLASYKRLPTTRSQDKSDVIQLIKIKNLDKTFADFLHPYVQNDFKDAVDGLERDKKQTEDVDER